MGIIEAIGATVLASIGGAVAGSAAAGTAIFTVSATVATIIGAGAILFTFGGIAMSIVESRRNLGASSPTYQNVLQTQTDQNLPIPLLYGTCKLAGNRIWQDENSQSTIKRIVAFAEGEICEYSDIKMNDISINEISGVNIKKYYGTQDQVVDEIVGGKTQKERAEKVGSLKNVAYLAISVPKQQKIDTNYNLTAVVKGRKIRVYKNAYEYEIKYSENPAWAMFDFLTCYNGLGLGIGKNGMIDENLIKNLFDLESFIEAAAYCDELLVSKEKNENDEEITVEKPRFTFNMIFDAQTSARTLIDEIHRCCRGGLFIKDGKLQFKIDKAEPVSKIFTEEDILKGSETFQTIPQEEHYDILKCTFISPKHEWQKVEATAELPEYRDGVPIEHSVNMYSVTNFHQASRLAWYYVNSKRLQPYFGSFKTGYKAYDLEVGDVIRIDSILMGLKNYPVKINSITDEGAGVFTINWRTYDERLYSDELGSKEPKVLVSSLTDIVKYPEDILDFNVIQSNNMFNFIWRKTSNSFDTSEIRMGHSWENSTVLKSKITDNKFSTEIPSNGVFHFWIKAFNGYNYSENATLDIISVDSVPNLNEIVKINLLENMEGIFDENLNVYLNKIKLKELPQKWQNLDTTWQNTSGYYQNSGKWGGLVIESGTYLSQVYDIGEILSSIVSFDYKYITKDEQNQIIIEWAYSDDNINYTDWLPINSGTYAFRYCKFRITLVSQNGVQIVLSDFVVNIDVPDKTLDLELEITDPEGLMIDYKFIEPPSIIATVNDNNNAYIVVTEKTNKYAFIKAFTNSGEATTAKLSLRAKGY